MLDTDQAQVVAHEEGPAVVLAGAGSGKTRCTTERALRRLTESGVPSESMVLLTFTNKAAGEMRERLGARLPTGHRLPWIGTFHSFGNQLLRRHGERIGVPRNATLMDAEDAYRMLDALLASPFANRDLRLKASRIHEQANANGLDATDPADLAQIKAYCDGAGFGPVAAARFLEALRRYEREKRRAGVMDFSDLILLPVRLLRQDEELRARLIGELRDITVDEAQDTDGAQFRLLRYLVPEQRTVLLVGDDDQAIYEWRHARPENLKDFIDTYDARIYRLERNYRSTPAIVSGGAALVRHNDNRLEKNPYAVRAAPERDTVTLNQYHNAEAMAEGVAEALENTIRAGTSAADIAVLYRKNRLSRTVETALLRRGLPYRIKAGTDLLGYADVRMMLAAGRLAANQRDIRALSRLAELVPGLGAKGVGRLLALGDEPLRNANHLAPKTARAVDELAESLQSLYRTGPTGLFDWCRQTPLFSNWLARRAQSRLRGSASNTSATEGLQQAMRPALARMGAIQRAMTRRLEPLSADAGADQRWATALEVVAAGSEDADGDTPRITLCTVHAAKGLEWPLVHLFGFSEGLMPMARDGEIGNLAEERRLAYVALTRACNNVVLHHADRLDLGTGDGAEALEVSRFLDEIRRGHNVEWMDRRPGAASPADTEGKDSPRDWLSEMRKALT